MASCADSSQVPFSSIAEPALLCSLEGRILWANRSLCQALGCAPEELIGLPIQELDPLVRPEDLRLAYRALARFPIERLARQLQRRDGSTWAVWMYPSRVRLGRRAALLLQLRERREDQDWTGRLQERVLEFLFRQSIAGLYLMRMDPGWEFIWDGSEEQLERALYRQRVVRVNRNFAEQYGTTEEALIGRTSADFYAHDPGFIRDYTRRMLDAGYLRGLSYERRLDGTPIWIEGEYIPLYDEGGRYLGHLGIQRDVTEERLRSERLERQRQALLEMTRLSAQDWPESLYALLERTAQALTVDRCGFWLWDPQQDALRCVALFDQAQGGRVACEQVLSASAYPEYFWALQTGLAVDAADAWTDPRTRAFLEGYLKPLGIRAMLDAPVWREGRLMGVLCSELRAASPRTWHADEVRFAVASAERLVRLLEEHERRTLEGRLTRFVENASDLIYQVDLEGRLLYANEAALRLFGYTREEAIGRRIFDFIEPSHYWRARAEAIRHVRARTPHWYSEYPVRDRTGQVRWVGQNATLRTEGGQLVGFDVISRDITDRKHMEAALEASERRYRMLFESAGDAILISDAGGRYVEVNRQAELLTGYSRQELLAMTVGDLVVGDREALNRGYREHFYPFLRQVRIFRGADRRMRRKDGTLFDYEVTAVMLDDGRVMALVRDVTERKRAEAALREAKERAEMANRIKSNFLAMISHELRTPLHTILGYLDLIREELASEGKPEVEEFFAVVHRSAQRLVHLVYELLDMARIESGDLELVCEVQPAEPLVQEAFATLASRAREKGLLYELRLHTERTLVYVDGGRLIQVLLNLIENAIKFTSSGSVQVSTRREGDRLVIAVSDTGVGIEPEHLERLFRPFEQAHEGLNRPFEGAGLGLAISYRLVRSMGGELRCQSQPGRGATFSVHLPVASEPVPPVFWQPKARRALLMESDPEGRRYLEVLLRRAGFSVQVCDKPADLLEALTSGQYDAVFVELTPEAFEVGITLGKQVRQLRFRGRMLALAAYAESGLEDRVRAAGFDGLLVKPFQPRQVLSWLEEAS
ncbi:MAG: PAS domain S-box protein [Bacteroidota bacterium]|nr:PAS domain S-box protein [Rhodothermia bacterium]MDW8285955.1 PAS domain S-box protein [Bacteroidota bacterium]